MTGKPGLIALLLPFLASATPFVASTTPSGGANCSTAFDCSLAGDCTVAGRCACDLWATGSNCSMLNLAPADPDNGLQLPGYHSWGGHAVRDPHDISLYHGYFSFMLGGCTLSSWTTNSAIIHGVSSSPAGPFVPAGPTVYPPVAGVMVPPWAHSAFVVQNPTDRMWLLWHIGGATTPSTQWKNCSKPGAADGPEVPAEATSPSAFESGGPAPGNHSNHSKCWWLEKNQSRSSPRCGTFYVHTSASVDGPWSAPVLLYNTLETENSSWWKPGGHNPSMPAPFIFDNGTTLVYFQAKDCPAGWGNAAPACVGVLRAPTWRGPYEHVRTTPIVHPESEDPFVFKTKRGFHLLTNVNTYHKRCAPGVPCGGHAWSEDGLEWSDQVIGAFGPVIRLVNGTVVRNSYVERPQVYQNPDTGDPEVLYVGLTRPDGYSDSVSWAQHFCQPGQAGCGPTV